MLDLSPTKLLVIFVVVVVLLGPKRLPEVARQLGAGWRKLRELHMQVDRELRQSLPDLPSSQDIVRFARSPVSLLNALADRHEDQQQITRDDAGTAPPANGAAGTGESANGASANGAFTPPRAPAPGLRPAVGVPTISGLDTDDPNLN